MFFRFHLYTFLWAILILLLSLYSGKDLPTVSFWQLLTFDKAMHLTFYTVLMLLMIIGAKKQYKMSRSRYKVVGSVLLICVFYGFFIEILQSMIAAERYFDYYDIVANMVGCIFGLFIYNFVYH